MTTGWKSVSLRGKGSLAIYQMFLIRYKIMSWDLLNTGKGRLTSLADFGGIPLQNPSSEQGIKKFLVPKLAIRDSQKSLSLF